MKKILLLTGVLASFNTLAEDLAVGPSGGMGGGTFADLVPASYKLVGVTLCGGTKVDSIQSIYSVYGQIVRGTKHGGNGGSCETLMTSGTEYLVDIMGCRSETTVTSLEITTSRYHSVKKGLGTCSNSNQNFLSLYYGNEDYSETTNRRIRGFSGRSGSYLDAIGVVIGQNPDNVTAQTDNTFTAGTSGGLGGSAFYTITTAPDKINKLTLCSGSKIDSIRVNDGQKFGGNGGSCSSIYFSANEYIREISGYYNSKGTNGISSMNVVTTYGRTFQFGDQSKSNNYSYKGNANDNIITGLVGRSGDRIDAIGVFYK